MFVHPIDQWLAVENERHLLALFVVVKFFVVIGFVLFLVWSIRRGASKQCPDTNRLLDELESNEPTASKPEPDKDPPVNNEWERDADWWKNKND